MPNHVVIIGNGIAGVTAARNIRKNSDDEITIISGETDYFFSRTALMYIYMGHMKFEHTQPYEPWFWEKNRISLVKEWVENVDFDAKTLSYKSGKSISYDKLIIATGSKPNKFGWPGQDLEGVQGLYSYQDLETMEKLSDSTQQAVIVGGGLIGIEMAEMFLSRGINVTFLVRENSFWNKVLPKEESEMINQHIREHHVELILDDELEEIIGSPSSRVTSIKTKKGREINCQFVGLTVGVHANVQFLKGSKLETDRGVLVNEYLETNITDVYAIGDCTQLRNPLPHRLAIEQVWYTGRMMGETLAETITGNKKEYRPGIWFNSAKFFDIEYQVYGKVNAQSEPHEKQLFWKSEDNKKSIRIIYHKESEQVIGFNLLGVRYRHEVCDRWLREKRDIKYVLEHLRAANFDPEFFRKNEQALVDIYNEAQPSNPIVLKSKKSILNQIFGVK